MARFRAARDPLEHLFSRSALLPPTPAPPSIAQSDRSLNATLGAGASSIYTAPLSDPSLPDTLPSLRRSDTDSSASEVSPTSLHSGPSLRNLLFDPDTNDRITNSSLRCILHFTGCHARHTSFDEWSACSRTHFHLKRTKPPRLNSCPLCEWQAPSREAWSSWDQKLRHFYREHYECQGVDIGNLPLTFDFLSSLAKTGLIERDTLQHFVTGSRACAKDAGPVRTSRYAR